MRWRIPMTGGSRSLPNWMRALDRSAAKQRNRQLTSGKHIRSVVRGIGSYLPARKVSNADLEKMVDTSDDWIVQRTGIRNRHIAGEDETTSMLATMAARAALDHAGLT